MISLFPEKDEADAISNLNEVINICSSYGLALNLDKCMFLKTKVQFLGHIFSNLQISPSPLKVEAVMRFSIPTNLKQLLKLRRSSSTLSNL